MCKAVSQARPCPFSVHVALACTQATGASMRSKRWWILICLGFSVLSAVLLVRLEAEEGDDELHVLRDGVGPAEPSKMLYPFLLGEAQKLFDERRAAVAAIQSPEDL